MKCTSLSLALLGAASLAFAQSTPEARAGAASQAYRLYRQETTEPPFRLARVKAIVKGIRSDSSDNRALPAARYRSLSEEEKFTYTMLHGETFSQNCDVMPVLVDEEKKIFAQLPDPFGEESWSDRQRAFLRTHRGRVLSLIRSTIRARHRAGANLKHAILEIKGYETIPDLTALYKRDRRDQDILTLLQLLMKEGHYKPFLASTSFVKLYGANANYQSFLVANPANQNLIISRAMAFYNGRRR